MLIEIDELTRRAEAERLGNEIALLAAHIEVATGPPAGAYPRVRRPLRLGDRLPVVRPLAELSRRHRPARRRALQRRDQGCRFPGCGLRYAQGHHIRHWAVERLADGALQFRQPQGWVIPEVPEPPEVAADAGDTPAPTAGISAGPVRPTGQSRRAARRAWLG
jgi:hypothetical protein